MGSDVCLIWQREAPNSHQSAAQFAHIPYFPMLLQPSAAREASRLLLRIARAQHAMLGLVPAWQGLQLAWWSPSGCAGHRPAPCQCPRQRGPPGAGAGYQPCSACSPIWARRARRCTCVQRRRSRARPPRAAGCPRRS